MSDEKAIIVVALDASVYSQVALEAAIALARDMDAELIGLFVEDVNLLRLAELPFTREVRPTTATIDPINGTIMTAALRRQAARAERMFNRAARRAALQATFRIVRDQVPVAVLREAVHADLLVLGRVSRPLTRQRRIGSTARAVVLQAPRSILITERSPRQARAVTVVIDDSAAGRQALTTALSLMPEGGELNLILYAPNGDPARLRAEVKEWLSERGLAAHSYRAIDGTGVDDVLAAAEIAPCDLLVVGGDALPTSAEDLQALAEGLECSLLVVR